MKNNIVTWDMLKCPPVELKCILEELVYKFQCPPTTTFTGSFANGILTLSVNGVPAAIPIPELDNQTLSLSGNILTISGGNTVDLTPFANIAETITTITGTITGNSIATYTNEAGATTVINETITSIVNNGDGTATYTNEVGATVTFPIVGVTAVDNGDGTYTLTLADGSSVTITDTSISPLVKNADGTLTYTDETGLATTFSVGDVVTDNGDGTYLVTKPDGSTITISDVVSTLIDNGNGTFTYTDESGATTTFSAGVPETITTVTNTITGNKIADYTNEAGVVVAINETVTALDTPTLTGNILTIPYINEAGVTQTVNVDLSGLASIDINLDSATYNAAANIITLTETDGTTHTLDLSEFSIITTTNPDGSITVVQEGVTKFIIPAPIPDQPQIFAKVGGVQTTNTVSHLESEVAVRTGAVVIGATTAPTTVITKLDVTNGDVDIDNTTATTGAITKNGVLWNHNYGVSNSFNGLASGNRYMTGNANTGNGANTLASNTSGIQNVANGTSSMYNNTTGSYNSTNGVNALFNNTTGSYNIATGSSSLFNNTTGIFNVGTGANALNKNTTGTYNVATGPYSLNYNITGNYNVATGLYALHTNSTASFNTSTGAYSLFNNTIGNNNVADGINALYYNTTNNQNTAIGAESFNSYNTLSAGATLTASTATEMTISPALTGTWAVGDTIFIKWLAPLTNSISGFYEGVYTIVNANTISPARAGVVLGLTGTTSSVEARQGFKINNATALGYNSEPTASNQVMLGNLAVTEVRTAGAFFGTAFNIVSDKRNKYIGDVVATKTLFGEKIDIYEYQLISDGSWHLGAIAQDVEAIEAKRGRFILTSKSYGLNYGATLEQFNSILGTSFKFYSDIDEQSTKDKIVEAQGISLKEAKKVLETIELVERLKLEVDEDGNSNYDGKHDKYLTKYIGYDLTGDETFKKYHVFEEMLSLSTAINTVLV